MIRTDIPIYILAGGQSRRIGYDKLTADIGCGSLLGKTIAVCSTVSNNLNIVAKDESRFNNFDTNVLLDDPSADGPMAGIITALRHSTGEYCFITAADFYDLTENVINHIIESYQDEQFLGLNINDRLQPLCGIYHNSCLPLLLEIAKTKNFKMIDALAQLNSRFMNMTLSNWRNINLPDDMENIRRAHV